MLVYLTCSLYYSGDEESEELEKRMGEVDKGETEEKEEDEELDRNMWAPEEEEQEEEKDVREKML